MERLLARYHHNSFLELCGLSFSFEHVSLMKVRRGESYCSADVSAELWNGLRCLYVHFYYSCLSEVIYNNIIFLCF